MKKLPHIYGKPLIIMLFAVIFALILFAGRCGGSDPQVIIIDTIPGDTVKVITPAKASTKKVRKSRLPKSKSVKQKREPKSRDYINERVDSIKYSECLLNNV